VALMGGGSQCFVKLAGCLFLHGQEHVGVRIQRQHDRGMPQPLRHELRMTPPSPTRSIARACRLLIGNPTAHQDILL